MTGFYMECNNGMINHPILTFKEFIKLSLLNQAYYTIRLFVIPIYTQFQSRLALPCSYIQALR